MIPFFVVDRPMSLNILKTSFVEEPSLTFGLMTHACVSKNFRRLFATFPCAPDDCWLRLKALCATRGLCPSKPCLLGEQIQSNIVRMCDSGIFEKNSSRLSYKELFAIYEEANADYGVMQDVLWDSKQTLAAAKAAIREYGCRNYKFNLVLVAQGKTVDEYLSCYAKLVQMGAQHIAIGGLLRKRVRSVRYMYVSDAIASQVLVAIRKEFAPKWLFVLGAYHPMRHRLFEEHGVFGSDYKGWIFQYEHRRDRIERLHRKLLLMEQTAGRPKRVVVLREERNQLSKSEQRQRLRYIQTKNDTADNSNKKARIRKVLKETQRRLSNTDAELLAARLELVSRNGLAVAYKRAVADLRKALGSSEQEIRVQGVHRYLLKRVYCLSSGRPDGRTS